MSRDKTIKRAIRHTIQRYCMTQTVVTASLPVGSTTIPVSCSGFFYSGSEISIGNNVCTVLQQTSNTALLVSPALSEAVDAGTAVNKLPTFEIATKLPKSWPSHPLVIIENAHRTEEPLTLGPSYRWDYVVSIGVYSEAGSEEETTEAASLITERIESVLHYLPCPIVGLYGTATLSEPMTNTDTVIRITDLNGTLPEGNEVIFCQCNQQKTGKIRRNLLNGIYELSYPVGSFSAGSEVIAPSMYGYNFSVSSNHLQAPPIYDVYDIVFSFSVCMTPNQLQQA